MRVNNVVCALPRVSFRQYDDDGDTIRRTISFAGYNLRKKKKIKKKMKKNKIKQKREEEEKSNNAIIHR